MRFVIESEGEKFHWIVKCIDQGKLLELHRFYRSLENFVYHRGKHGKYELDAFNALEDHFKQHPETAQVPPAHPRNLAGGKSR